MKVSDIKYERADLEKLKADLEKLAEELTAASSAEEQYRLVMKSVALSSDMQTAGALGEIRFLLNTEDEFYAKEHDYYDEFGPLVIGAGHKFTKAVLDTKFPELHKMLPEIMVANARIAQRTYDDSIAELLKQENAAVTEYSKLMASMTAEFDGKTLPVSMLEKFKASGDRSTRKAAWEAHGKAMEASGDKIDEIFDRMVKIRTEAARRLGHENFIALGYDRRERNCYNAADVKAFRENVLKDIVPLVAKLKASAAQKLGIDKIKLYDNETWFSAGEPAPEGSVEQIFDAAKKMYKEMSPSTGEFMDIMLEAEAFDVLPRKGKWGGGMMSYLINYKQPFILANFNGTAADVDVLTHEVGHAYAAYLNRGVVFPELMLGGMETAEVHSMAMEFFAWDWTDGFFGKRANDYRLKHLCESLHFIPYGTIVDYFQHIVYENPDMTPAERNAVWLELEREYRPYLSFEETTYFEKGTVWQIKQHIFELPFYHIDYCLAQSIALQFLDILQKDRKNAWDKYIKFVSYGGTLPFTGILAEAGLRSPFDTGALSSIAATAEKLLKKL